MAWRPLVADHRRAALAAIVREIVEGVETAAAAAPAGDATDRALLRAYAAEAEVAPDPDDAGTAALDQAIGGLAGARSPALFGGIAGVGWTVAHLAAGDAADQVCGRIDAALLGVLEDRSGSYDLISGLVGFGVYALERGAAGRPLAERVLAELALRARPRRGGLAWHTPPSQLVPAQRVLAPAGYWNLGLAHGAAGVIALLARLTAAGLDGARPLLERAIAALLAAEPPREGGRFSAWHAGSAEEADAEPVRPNEPRGRLAWCYNDLGVALALVAAGRALDDAMLGREAIEIARACAARELADAAVHDTGLCHGAIGAAHLFDRLRHATGDPVFAAAAEQWLARALALRTDRAIAGFPSRSVHDGAEHWAPDASLLDGATGVALVLCSMIADTEPAWDRLLLVDLDADDARPGSE